MKITIKIKAKKAHSGHFIANTPEAKAHADQVFEQLTQIVEQPKAKKTKWFWQRKKPEIIDKHW